MMPAEVVLARLRSFLLWVAVGLCAGTILELLLTNHTETPIQLLPFVLCGLGLLITLLTLVQANYTTLLLLRGIMGLGVLGSLLGIYEHITNNIAFELEIYPNATLVDIFLEALGGANPLLAPGILALAAILAIAATYHHPNLLKK